MISNYQNDLDSFPIVFKLVVFVANPIGAQKMDTLLVLHDLDNQALHFPRKATGNCHMFVLFLFVCLFLKLQPWQLGVFKDQTFGVISSFLFLSSPEPKTITKTKTKQRQTNKSV